MSVEALCERRVHLVRHADDGYRLTYLGYDFLAIKAMAMRDTLVGVGGKCGVGKARAACMV